MSHLHHQMVKVVKYDPMPINQLHMTLKVGTNHLQEIVVVDDFDVNATMDWTV